MAKRRILIMKKITIIILVIFFFILLIGLVFSIYYYQRINLFIDDIKTIDIETLSPKEDKNEILSKNIKDYDILRIKPNQIIRLIPNYKQKSSSLFTKNQYGCQALINGGFYDKNDKPIGLVVADGKQYSNSQNNSTMNGFIYQIESDIFISKNPPQGLITWALQTGPLLFLNNNKLILKLSGDEKARRTAVLTTDIGEIIFVSVFDNNNNMSGPFLIDLPSKLEEISKSENFKIENAVNLDGGSASAFITDNFSVSELTPVGSFFCIK